jgi:hypothetical protein
MAGVVQHLLTMRGLGFHFQKHHTHTHTHTRGVLYVKTNNCLCNRQNTGTPKDICALIFRSCEYGKRVFAGVIHFMILK